MAYYRVCPYCGAHLDCCEKCDCQIVTATDNDIPMYSVDAEIPDGPITQGEEVKNSA